MKTIAIEKHFITPMYRQKSRRESVRGVDRGNAASASFDLDQTADRGSARFWRGRARNSMSDPVSHWHTEHANFSRLLDLLEKQLDAFHEAGQPNYDLMVDIVSYLRHFPDLHHHPREDAAFALLAKHEPGMEIPLQRLRQEHRVIAAAGDDLLRTLSEVTSGAVIARAAVEAIAAMYLVYYRHHIASEEKEVLPRAAKLLPPATGGPWRLPRPAGAIRCSATRAKPDTGSFAATSRSRRGAPKP